MEKLDDFKVEALEQRLEMGQWSPATGSYSDGTGSDATLDQHWYGAGYAWTF